MTFLGKWFQRWNDQDATSSRSKHHSFYVVLLESVPGGSKADSMTPPSSQLLRDGRIISKTRRIRTIQPYNDGLFLRMRNSLLGKFYTNYLKRFPIWRWLVALIWRKWFAIIFRLAAAFRKSRPLVKLSVQAEQSPEGVFRLSPGETVETPLPTIFPSKDHHVVIAPQDRYRFPDIFVTTVREAMVAGGTNLILAGEEVLCHDLYDFPQDFTSEELHGRTVINPKTGRVWWLMKDPTPESVQAAASFVDACAFNYAHWMTEVLPRICLFCCDDRFHDVPIIVNHGLHKNIMESLFMVAGLEREIITLPVGRALRVDRLFAVSPTGYVPFERRTDKLAGHSHGKFSAFALNALVKKTKSENVFDDNHFPKKFIIRRNSGYRVVRNFDDIENSLLERGFSVIEPEKFTFREQAQLFSHAEIIVGTTGAALANIIFSKPSAQIVIMSSKHKDMPYGYWQNIACTVGCRVKYVLGDIVRSSDLGFHADFRVNPSDVLDAVSVS